MNLEQFLDAARRGDWSFFERIANPEVREKIELDKARSEEEQRMIDGAWARFAETPDGARALEQIFNTTLGRTVYFVALGLSMESTATWGAFREGQNSLAHLIATMVARGRNQEPPQPRNVE